MEGGRSDIDIGTDCLLKSGWCWLTTVCQDPCSAALDIVRVKCCDREQFSLTMFRVAGPRTLAWLLGWVAPPSASNQQLQHAVTVPGLASQQQHGSSGSLEHGKCGKLKSYFSDSFEYLKVSTAFALVVCKTICTQ